MMRTHSALSLSMVMTFAGQLEEQTLHLTHLPNDTSGRSIRQLPVLLESNT
jgi:hypothetical protein